MSYTPNARTDIYIRARIPVIADANGNPAPEGTTMIATYPVVAWTDDGDPLIALAATPGTTIKNGRMGKAATFPDYELCVLPPTSRDITTADPTDVVEVIPGSAEKLRYTLPDGVIWEGSVPLWGRRADGSLVALLTAETVPHVRTVERDEHGEITGVVEK